MSFAEWIASYKHRLDDYFLYFGLYRKTFSNYLTVVRCVLSRNYPIRAVLRDGKNVTFDHYSQVYNAIMGIDYNGGEDIIVATLKGSDKRVTLYGGKTNGDIPGVFVNEDYASLPVKDKVVLDIGANIGDSPIYFALRGAKKVFAIEPFKESYDLAVRNIRANHLEDRIELIWSSCSSVDNPTANPPLITLDNLIERYNINADILKIDCEGCEYDVIIRASNDTLRRFSHIQIEYHYGYKNLKEKLEKNGFKVTFTKPKYFRLMNPNHVIVFVGDSTYNPSKMFVGWLNAIK